METFGERLKHIRTLRNKKQKDLADALGLTQSTISQYEKNQKTPDMFTLRKIADELNVSTDYLSLRTDDPVHYTKEQLDLIAKGKNNPYLTPEDLKEYRFWLDGREATEQEIEEAINYIRFKWELKEKKDKK